MDLQLLTKNYLEQGKLLQLATSVNGQPWVVSVYFVYVGGNIYWLSFPTRRHSREIEENTKVAATVMIKQDRPVVGVEMAGEASVVTDQQTVKDVMNVYHDKYGEGDKFYANFLKGTNRHVMYCLTPREIVLFDEVNFPNNGRQVVL